MSLHQKLKKDVIETYKEILDDIKKSKVDNNVLEALKYPINSWKNNEKIARSMYIIPIIKKMGTYNKNIEKLLVSTDVVINMLDDTVDNPDIKRSLIWKREVCKIINFLYVNYLSSTLTSDMITLQKLINGTIKFIADISLIPKIEQEYFNKILLAKKDIYVEKYVVDCLHQRAMDIDIFSTFIINFSTQESINPNDIMRCLRSYRSLELFFKDLFDMKKDIAEGSHTPTLAIYQKYKQKKFINKLKEIFEYLFYQCKNSCSQYPFFDILLHLAEERKVTFEKNLSKIASENFQ